MPTATATATATATMMLMRMLMMAMLPLTLMLQRMPSKMELLKVMGAPRMLSLLLVVHSRRTGWNWLSACILAPCRPD